MTTDTTDPYAQFNALLNSNLPDEYKELLKHFKEQGVFYQRFIKEINSNESDLSQFWNIPSTLGFDSISNHQTEWFKSLFDFNSFQETNETSLIQQYIKAIGELPLQVQNYIIKVQSNLSKMNSLYEALSLSAMERFQALKNEYPNASNEQLCSFWLTAGENAFSEISLSKDYIDTQKELIKSLSELRKTQYTLTEQTSNLLGLPSRQSLEDLQQGLHRLRLEFAEYKEQTNAIINELKQTIRQLR